MKKQNSSDYTLRQISERAREQGYCSTLPFPSELTLEQLSSPLFIRQYCSGLADLWLEDATAIYEASIDDLYK